MVVLICLYSKKMRKQNMSSTPFVASKLSLGVRPHYVNLFYTNPTLSKKSSFDLDVPSFVWECNNPRCVVTHTFAKRFCLACRNPAHHAVPLMALQKVNELVVLFA
jgi:hypothetical protein